MRARSGRDIGWIAIVISLILACFGSAARAGELKVLVSIKPIHSLVAAIAEQVLEPQLLLEGSASPHAYVMSPSDAASLESADVVFWIGEGFERFLAQPIANLAGDSTIVALEDSDGLVLLGRREGGLWEHENHADHGHGGVYHDGHIWLDPRNAITIVTRVVEVLASRDPKNAAQFRANAARLTAEIAELDREIEKMLTPVKDRPYIVFHDAIQYFEKRYGLTGVGAITVSPDQPPGAKRLLEMRNTILARNAVCVLREPNVSPGLMDSIVSEMPVNTGILDPEGPALREGRQLYFNLMREMAASLRHCLEPSS